MDPEAEDDDLHERVREQARRIDQLESTVDRLQEQYTVTDQEGREWTVGDLVGELGLSRRQALAVLGMLAIGIPLSQALVKTASAGTAEVGTIGQSGSPVDLYGEDFFDTNDNSVLEFPGDGTVTITNDGSGSGIDADQTDGYDIAKDGTDGSGTINFKTS